MFRISFLLIFACLASLHYADGQKHPQFSHIGAGGGVNLAGIRSGLNYDTYDKNIGLNLGIKGNYSFSDLLSVGSEISFEQKGAVHEAFDVNTNLSYLSLPVYIEWTLKEKPRFFIHTGLYGSYLLGARRKGEMRANGQYVAVNESVSDDFRNYDAGLIFGGGFMVELNWDFDFFVSIRSSFGLINISANTDSQPRNYHFGITAGYIYYIGFR